MKGFDVLKIKSAVKARNKFDLSFDHLTTMQFGEIVPLLSIETVPGDKFSVKGNYFSRMAPLVKPTFGKFSFRTVQAFVPYYQLAEDIEPWLAGKTSWLGSTPKFRYFTVETLHAFVYNVCTGSTSVGATPDYVYIDATGNTVNRSFTRTGKWIVKVLNALGYALPMGVDLQSGSNWVTTIKNTKLSALPLLAFCKLYNDYMSQSQRYNTSVLSDLLRKIKAGIADANYWDSSTGAILHNGLNRLLTHVYLQFDNDYFTSAWQNPNNPLNNLEGINRFTVPGLPVAYPTDLASNVESNYMYNSSSTVIHQRALDMLRDFDNWVRRNNYSGSREVQQLYSRFGIKTEDYKANYAHVISVDSMPIQVGDVTSTADTTDAQLGEYAGKGIMNGSKGFSYSCDDFGMLFVFGYFTVVPMMAYGYDRSVLRSSPLDYYNPEFDGLGAEAISVGEVYEDCTNTPEQGTLQSNQVFGYTERYNSYRYGRDKITGEFRNYDVDNDMNTWHSGRILRDLLNDGDIVAQNSLMNSFTPADIQFNRIFSITDASVDSFYLTCHFEVDAIRPMMNLNQVVNLGEGDTHVPRNGNTIS